MSSRFRYRELPHATVGVEALALTPDYKSGVGLTLAMSASERRQGGREGGREGGEQWLARVHCTSVSMGKAAHNGKLHSMH